MTDPADLLRAYDDQLRDEAETSSAIAVERIGPLRLATFLGGRGFITYRSLDDVPEGTLPDLVARALAHYTSSPEVLRVEWKTRGHDRAPGLHDALVAHGFVPGDPESVMVGELRLLVDEVELPPGVVVRRVTEEADVRAMCAMQDEVFGQSPSREYADAILHRLRTRDDIELWVAEAGGEVVGAGRLEPVDGSDFAGIWGGATRPEWRGRGIYRALTAARARSALARGKPYVNSDSTEYSRPILERSGLVKVSTTTPYEWRRGA